MGVGGQRHAPAALPPGMRPITHCTEGSVGLRAGLGVFGGRIRTPERPAHSESLYYFIWAQYNTKNEIIIIIIIMRKRSKRKRKRGW